MGSRNWMLFSVPTTANQANMAGPCCASCRARQQTHSHAALRAATLARSSRDPRAHAELSAAAAHG